MTGIHRDDVPMDVVEEFEKFIKETYGENHKVLFTGDHPDRVENNPELKAAIEALEESFRQSIINGTCQDCGAKMPGVWPPPDDEEELEEWDLADGWSYYSSLQDQDEMLFLVCPDCDNDEEQTVIDVRKPD